MSKSPIMMQCPRCKEPCEYNTKNDFRPFCSTRCKDDDITAWADGDYRSPDRETSPEELLDEIRNLKN